jgi:hypothetical protein
VKTATRERLRDSLKLHEGLRLKPYKDSIGKLTIGFGRNLDDNGIRPNEAAYMLEGDIDEAEQGLLINHPWAEDIDQVRLAALQPRGQTVRRLQADVGRGESGKRRSGRRRNARQQVVRAGRESGADTG